MKTETETAQSNAALDCFWFSFSCSHVCHIAIPCHPFETLVFNIYFIALTTTITTLPPISPTVIPPGPGWMVDGSTVQGCKVEAHSHRGTGTTGIIPGNTVRRRKNPIHNRWTRVCMNILHTLLIPDGGGDVVTLLAVFVMTVLFCVPPPQPGWLVDVFNKRLLCSVVQAGLSHCSVCKNTIQTCTRLSLHATMYGCYYRLCYTHAWFLLAYLQFVAEQ